MPIDILYALSSSSGTQTPAITYARKDKFLQFTPLKFAICAYSISQWITNILTHPLIEVRTGCSYTRAMNEDFEHVFYSGPIDEYFNYAKGPLGYRTVTFETIRGDFEQQGCGCINYSDLSVPYTRSHEHNYFSPWEQHEKSVVLCEYSSESTINSPKIYPKRMSTDMQLLDEYCELTKQEDGVSFIGRLGCYRYLDMQQCVMMALEYAETWLKWKAGELSVLPKMPRP